jgi:hypothetical protein
LLLLHFQTQTTKKHSLWHVATEEIDNDYGYVSCKYCDGNYELKLFCNIVETQKNKNY